MWQKTLLTVGMMKNYLSFFLTLLSISGSLLLGWFKGVDQTVLLPSLLGLYLSARVYEKTAMVKAASLDSASDTESVIKMVTGK